MTRRIVALVLVALATGGVAPAFAKGSGGSAPPPAQKASHDEEAAVFIQDVVTTRSSQNDDAAVSSAKHLSGIWKDTAVTAGTKQPIPGLLLWYARRKSSSVALAGIAALGDLGKGPGSQNLTRVLEGLLAQKDAPADRLTAVFAGLKSAADPDPAVVGPLLACLANKDRQIAMKAIDVFGALGAATVATRRHLFDQLLAAFEPMALAAAKPEDKDAVERWALLASPAAGALGALSHHTHADIAAARKWENEHGSEADAWK